MNQLYKKGFTLIELLVVISIIGVLATIIISAVGESSIKATDLKDKVEAKTIAKALQIYFLDNNSYAVAGGGANGLGYGWLDHQYGAYPSVSNRLGELGYIPENSFPEQNTRILTLCNTNQNHTLYIKLVDPSAEDLATLNNINCYNSYAVVTQGMNYIINDEL